MCRLLGEIIGGGSKGFEAFLQQRLLKPAGMDSVTIKFDDAGTWIGSSFLYATARDYLAFGELFRNHGRGPGGEQVLPQSWVVNSLADHATCPDSGQGYGLHWWLTRDGHGSFSANGYEGQRTQVSPDLGLTFVRLGKTSAESDVALREFYAELTNCFVG